MSRLTKVISLLILVLFACGFVLLQAFGKPGAPQQPVEYSHWQHVTKADGPQLDCTFCHAYAEQGAHATIPNVSTCMGCHQSIKTESPEVQKLAGYAARGEQPPWVRVYWFEPSANAYFNHKAHAGAGIQCTVCHGQVGQMQRVGREVEPTMGWCIDCHREQRASIDCYVCHR